MPQYRTTVGADGTIALPAALRKKLKITEGSEVEFYLSLDGDVFFHAITGTAKGWRGLFETEVRAPPLSIREMDQAIGEAVARRRSQDSEPGGAPDARGIGGLRRNDRHRHECPRSHFRRRRCATGRQRGPS